MMGKKQKNLNNVLLTLKSHHLLIQRGLIQTPLKSPWILHYLGYVNCLKTTVMYLSMTLAVFYPMTTSHGIFQLRFSPPTKPGDLGGKGLHNLAFSFHSSKTALFLILPFLQARNPMHILTINCLSQFYIYNAAETSNLKWHDYTCLLIPGKQLILSELVF